MKRTERNILKKSLASDMEVVTGIYLRPLVSICIEVKMCWKLVVVLERMDSSLQKEAHGMLALISQRTRWQSQRSGSICLMSKGLSRLLMLKKVCHLKGTALIICTALA